MQEAQEAWEAHLLARHELQRAVRAKVQHRIRLQQRSTPLSVTGLVEIE